MKRNRVSEKGTGRRGGARAKSERDKWGSYAMPVISTVLGWAKVN